MAARQADFECAFDDDPVYDARWRAGIAVAYCDELHEQATMFGLLDYPPIQERIRLAEVEKDEALKEARKCEEKPL